MVWSWLPRRARRSYRYADLLVIPRVRPSGRRRDAQRPKRLDAHGWDVELIALLRERED